MAAGTQDRIEKKLVINASRQKVWQCLTVPSEIVKWFCERVEGEIALGEEAVMIWGKDRSRIRTVILEEFERFGYRWIPGINDDSTPISETNSTLVLFTMREVSEGIEVEMVESGFAALQAEAAEHALRENTSGWDHELRELAELLG